ncbi:MAG: enoyl-CoA hydratase/isomerase family protein [Deltaproteobacteria bacterium]|nr:enoyl-CoA hydratase/isomerase family protein [Deltaproteobacteria bacterium]
MPIVKTCDFFRLEAGEVSVLTFSSPGANILSTAALVRLIDAMDSLRADEVKAVVITAEGGTFIAGADIKEMSVFSQKDAGAFAALFHRAMNIIEEFPCPVIAAVNGFALGGGAELTLACDIVIASEAAVFGQPEINLGIIPGGGATQRLSRRVGGLKAKEMIFTGRRVNAAEALAIGLVNKVVAKDKLMDEAMAVARAIASKPVQCLAAAKSLINSGTPGREIDAFGRMFSYDDPKRLMDEFLARKK